MKSLDAARTFGRFLGTGLSLSRDIAESSLRSFPQETSDITAPWLSRALENRFPNVRVRAIEILDSHSGTTSRARVRLDYEETGGHTSLPETLFLKITPRALPQRFFMALNGTGRSEASFYRSIRAGIPVRVPGVYGVEDLGPGRQFVLLLEDLAAGTARFTRVGQRASLEDAQSVMGELARLHAAFWESPRFETDLSWVPTYESRRRDRSWERFVTGAMIRRAERGFAEEFGPEFRKIAATCRDGRDRLEQLWNQGPRTLAHGDCHIGNLFFEDERAGFLDWQVCGCSPGMRDVSYFLCNSFPTQLRRQHEHELVRLYLDNLEEAGVQGQDFETAWRQHRLFALYTWIAAAFTAAAGEGLQPRAVGLAGLARATTAAEELESLACVYEGRSSQGAAKPISP